jgi:hypothetical protein
LLRILVIALVVAGCGELRSVKTTKSEVEKFDDGKIRKITKITTRKNKQFELHENFFEEVVTVREYYRNGKLKYETKTVHHAGLDYPCREALYQLKQYDSTGVKRLFIETECDCHIQSETTWNSQGKVLVKSRKIIKRLY